jgi:hypothetical protein
MLPWSAKQELLLVVIIIDAFTNVLPTGKLCLIGAIVPEARRMPLYRWINDPFRALQARESAKSETAVADLPRGETAAT